MENQFRFGEIEFEGISTADDTAKFVKVNSKCNLELETIKKQWEIEHPNLLLSVMGGAWDFPISSFVKEVFKVGTIKATTGTRAWVLTSGTDVGAAKYCADAIYESHMVNEGMGIENTTSTVGITSWNWLLNHVKNKLDVSLDSGEPAVLINPSSADHPMQMPTDRMLNPHHSHFILIDDSSTMPSPIDFNHGAAATLHLRSRLEKAMSTYKVEATESDFADVLETVKPADLPKFFQGLGMNFYHKHKAGDHHMDNNMNKEDNDTGRNASAFEGVDLLRKWKTHHGNSASRTMLIRALKKCNTEAKKNIEWKWREGQVPVVCIYVEGGSGVISHACQSVAYDITIVVVDSSGRAASLLAMAWRSDGLKRDNDMLKAKLEKIIGSDQGCMFDKIIASLKDKRHLWNVYTQGSEIDQIILEAVMSAYSENISRQLDLAQTWNRYDIITKEFFINMIENFQWDDYNAEAQYFEERLHTALVNDQPGFVKLFLENGVITDLSSFLTRNKLQSLYDEVKDTPLDYFKNRPMGSHRKSNGLTQVGHVIHSLTSQQYHPYKEKEKEKEGDEKDGDEGNEKFCDPHIHLFLFAVVNNYHEMAEYFWQEGSEHMATALTATAIYKNMAHRLSGDNEDLKDMAQKYELLAGDILSECDSMFETDTVHNLLLRTQTAWGHKTCVSVAEAALCRQFLSHDAVQQLIREIWYQGLPVCSDVVTPTSIKERITRTEKVAPQGKQNGHTKRRPRSAKTADGKKQEVNTSQHYFLRAILSPRAKLVYNTGSFILLVTLFTYIMISNKISLATPTWWEILLIIWVCTLIVEEIRQIAQELLHGKWLEYVSNYWNLIDTIMQSLFVIGIIFRFIPSTREAGRILLAIDLFFFYFRLLELLTISRQLGPKVLMIFKMFVDLAFFIVILFVVLVAYGLTAMLVQYPQNQMAFNSWDYYRYIFYIPYYQIFGELFLEDILATPSDGTCTNNITAIELGAAMCPKHSAIGLLLLAFFMMISNVLLLNLLIAIFSDTFAKVQEETDVSWKYQFYTLTKEYFRRPILTPPFIIIVDLYRSLRWVLRKTGVLMWHPEKMQLEFFPPRADKLIKLETAAAYQYITRKRREELNQHLCQCFHHTENSKKRILARLNEFEEMPSM